MGEVEVEPQQEQAQSIIIDDDEDISFEYYSEKEEQEEYEHNSSLVSLLATRPTLSSSYTSFTTPTATKNDRPKGLSSHQYSSSSLSFLHFDHQKEAGNEFCVTSSTPERDSSSIRS